MSFSEQLSVDDEPRALGDLVVELHRRLIGLMLALSVLREPVDSFFEGVLVNDEDQAVRANRLALLARIRAATDQVADFSRIAG